MSLNGRVQKGAGHLLYGGEVSQVAIVQLTAQRPVEVHPVVRGGFRGQVFDDARRAMKMESRHQCQRMADTEIENACTAEIIESTQQKSS